MQQYIKLQNRVNLSFRSQLIRHGVPWPCGALPAGTMMAALDEDGQQIPIAGRTLNSWPDGSVQWSLVDLAVDVPANGKRRIIIDTETAPEADIINPVTVQETGDRISVGNGLAHLVFGPAAIVEQWTSDGRTVIEDGGFDVQLEDAAGTTYSAAADSSRRLTIEDVNPLCATLRIDGKHQAEDGSTLLDFWLRFRVTANRADVKITYHYRNLEDAEPGIELRSMAMRLHSALPADATRAIVQVNRGRDFQTEYFRLADDLEICSSNTMALDTYEETHQARGILGGGNGRVFIRDLALLRENMSGKPWFLRDVVDFKFKSGDHPEAYVFSYLGLTSETGSLVVAGGNMVGLHPKSLSIEGKVIRYAIWPDWAGVMDVTQGEGRTLDFYVGPLAPDAGDEEIARQYFAWEGGGIYPHFPAQPCIAVSLDPVHVRKCQVFSVDKLPAYDPQAHFGFERKVLRQWTPAEAPAATGHWHYGDVFSAWDIGVNNEEMAGLVWFQEYLRSGRAECLDRGLAQAQHIADVDIVAYSSDPYQNGGMCAHGPRHNHCAAYPSHMWFTELLFAYALTGDDQFRKAAARVCDNLVFWINDPQGFDHICNDGREAGQPLINLAWCYRFIPEERYLAAMWKVVREGFMANAARHDGRLVYMKPREDMPLLQYEGYGEWAAWEGLYWVWELTRDEELREFLLSQFEWRLTEEQMRTHGSVRETDYNAAAYAWYMTEDPKWLHRVARPFAAMFRCAQWSFGWIKAMYFIHLAFEHGIIRDEDVLIS